MTAWTPMRWMVSLVTTGCLGLLALTAQPAAAASARSAAVPSVRPKPIDHFNVGAAHSPQLLRQLAAGSVQGASTVKSATTASTSKLPNAAQGVDVASYQEKPGINWSSVAGNQIKFAAVKATEGDYYDNPYALHDLAAAKAAGLSVVAYAFAIPNGGGSSASPVTQANDIINYLQSGSAGVPPIMLDIEYDPYASQDGTNQCYGLSASAMVTWISQFAAQVKNRTGLSPIIYSTTGWWSTCTGKSGSFAGDPLWIASVNGKTTPGTLPASWPAGGWTYWQYDQGAVSGISGSVDLDQLTPNLLALLNPGDQQDATGSTIQPVQLLASIPGVTYSSADLPSSLSLDSSTGVITGTAPTIPGTAPVTVKATESSPSAQQSVTFSFHWHGTLSVTSPGNRSTAEGSPVDLQVATSDSPAEPPVTFSAPVLPPGLSITTVGLITGWPEAPGTYHVTVYAADTLQAADSASFTWTVSAAPNQGPAGPVRLDLGGKCLNDVGNKATSGTQLDIWTCNRSTAQKWTYVQDESLRIHGMCLAAQGTVGWKVLLEPCTGAASLQWRLVYPRSVNSAATGKIPLTLVNPASGWCLADPGGTTNGTRMVARSCNGNAGQAWTLPAGPVKSQLPGKCLDDHAGSTANGNKIDLWTCNGTAAQAWTAEPDGTLRVRGKCLDVHAGGTASGTAVVLWWCNRTRAQQWHLASTGAGVSLVNPHSGKCLTDPGDRTGNGTVLQIATCAGAPGQKWRVQ